MPAGLQTFDVLGNLVIDTSTRVGTLLGTVDTGKSDGSVVVPAFSLGTPFWSITSLDSSYTMYAPRVEAGFIDGAWRIKWVFNVSGASYNNTFRITYGVF
jgi:hypothetical protein